MIGTVLAARYEIIDTIGEGGMAEVFRAVDLRLKREVAVKLLHAHLAKNTEFVRRFQQEAAIAARLEHPNVVTIFDYGIHGDSRAFIVFELIRGQDFHRLQLERSQARLGPFEPLYCALVVEEVLKGLQCAHALNCIHRDVKPDNVMITSEGFVKLTDFGIAKNPATSITVVGRFIGSPSYASPEQVQAQPIDHRSDLYSTGIIFYEALTGELPFSGMNVSEVMLRIAQGKYRRLLEVNPSLPPALDLIVNTALQVNVQRRYQNAEAFGKELRKFLSQYGIEDSRSALEEYHKNSEAFLSKHSLKVQSAVDSAKAALAGSLDQARIDTVERKARTSEQAAVVYSQAKAAGDRSGHTQFTKIKSRLPNSQKSAHVRRHPMQSHARVRVRREVSKRNSTGVGGIVSLIVVGMAVVLAGLFTYSYLDSSKIRRAEPAKQETVTHAPPKFKETSRTARKEPAREQKEQKSRPEPVAIREPEPRRNTTARSAPPRRSESQTTYSQPIREATSRPAVVAAPATPVERSTPEVPTVGRVVVQSIPGGLSVYVDNQFVGETAPGAGTRTFEVKPGAHTLRVQGGVVGGTKYDTLERKIFVEAGRVANLGVLRLQAYRTLSVRISGPNVIVKINNDPYAGGRPISVALPEGKVNVEAWSSNGKRLSRVIDLRGEDFALNASLD